jgi:DNA polymerase I-like protein with 3'-5' exonuclease and polymerase domains
MAIPYPIGDVIALDVETTGLNPYTGDRIFCWGYFSNKGEYGFMRKTPAGLAWIRRLFNDPTKKIVFQNGKFDLKMFTFEGIDVFEAKCEFHCTLILAKMFNGMMFSYDMVTLARKFLNRVSTDKTDVTDWLKANKRAFVKRHGRDPNFSDAPIDLVKRRCVWDVETTIMLYYWFKKRVDKICPDLYKTERQLMLVVVDMENTGIEVDITRAKLLRAKARSGVKAIQREIDRLVCPFTIKSAVCLGRFTDKHGKNKKCKRKVVSVVLKSDGDKIPQSCPKCGGTEFQEVETTFESLNTNSSAIQVPAAFEKMGYQLKYKTKPKKGKKGGKPTGGGRWSFDEYAMLRYVSPKLARVIRDSGEEGWPFEKWHDSLIAEFNSNDLHPRNLLPPLILKLNELKKLISTYYDHLIDECVDVRTLPNGKIIGVLHAKFNQSEAMSGRFSSSSPNMQNMPRILGPRECFVPRKGRWNWHIDYEQVEMKFFVHFAEDKLMAVAIESDVHLAVAAQIYDVRVELVTKEMRKRAKGVNFGIIYGSGAATMAETLTKKGLITTVPEAKKLVQNYHRKFPSVRRATNKFKIELNRCDYVTNPYQRRYYIDKKKGYKCLNYMCQGTSADLMKAAMVRVWKWLRANNYKTKLILQVHDELGFEVPQSEAQEVIPQLIALMEDRTSFFIPITVDAEIVRERWSKKEKPKDLGYLWN